jgi:hypothetical protein
MTSDVEVLREKPEKQKHFIEVIVKPQKARTALSKHSNGMTEGALDTIW